MKNVAAKALNEVKNIEVRNKEKEKELSRKMI